MPREECCRRLAAAIDPASAFRGSRQVAGSVSAETVQLRKRIEYRNSFQYLLTATLADAPGGTRIRGRFAMHPFTLVFMAVFVAFVGSIAVGVLRSEIGPLLSGNAPPDGWAGLIPFGMLAGVAVMALVGRAIGMSEGRFLADFVRTTVEAA